jgi:hypothetical protein
MMVKVGSRCMQLMVVFGGAGEEAADVPGGNY